MTPRIACSLLLALCIAACAPNPYRKGLALIEAGDLEGGLAELDKAAKADGAAGPYRSTYFRQRELAVQRLFAVAQTAWSQGQRDNAEAAYRRIVAIDPQNGRAKAALQALGTERRHHADLATAEELLKKNDGAGAEAKVRGVLAENGSNREAQQLLRRIEERALRAAAAGQQLSPAMREPISLEFRDGTLRQIFEAITKSTELNILFDRDVRPDTRTTIFVRNSSVEDVLRFILVTNQLEKKVLSENTILVYPNTPAKLKDYQELVTKTFYLANADAKSIAGMIRSLVKTKDVYLDEKLNLVVMRDTVDAVRMAERLVATQDLAEPEVMLEVEVREVSANALYELGIRYPDSLSVSLVGASGTPGSLTLNEWRNRNSDVVRLRFNDPLLAIHFRNQLDRASLLANPRIRVKNKDKARVHIGDKVPVITTTSTATGFAAESVSYLDVGLKLDVEPVVFLEDEVGMKIGLEVSNIAREIKSSTGTLTYQIGTRNAATTLRLRDGETQILAGLISDEDRRSASQIPGLGDLPVLGRLFGSHLDTRNKTEIVLLITPHVIRNLVRPELRFEEFPSGTESAVGARPMLLPTAAVQTSEGAPTAPTKRRAAQVQLQAPPNIPAGQEFVVQVSLESETALRSGLLDFAFDPSRLKFIGAQPGALIVSADPDASFRFNAPEAMGRADVSFTAKADVKGKGELAKLVFQVMGNAAGAPLIRLEALSFTGTDGLVVGAPLPPPLSLSLTR
jgi:general secretion pathway protein D